MTGVVRSLWVLFIATFVGGMLAVSAAPSKAMASDPMDMTTEMGSGDQDCKKCNPAMDMMAGCVLSCPSSSAVGLSDQAMPSSDLTISRFERADVIFVGRSPSPAFTPPRTTILV
ncbi:MAG: hypothetical protein V4753_12420 [Pseudomonadota bacterium]